MTKLFTERKVRRLGVKKDRRLFKEGRASQEKERRHESVACVGRN